MLLILVPTVILLFATDASKMYHTVRGQDTIKLYVIFNALEVSLELDELIRSPIDYVARLDKTYWIRSLRETPWRQGWALGGERRGHSSSLPCH